MERYPDKINLDELYERDRKQYQQREKIYSRILNRAHTQIKTTSRQRNSEKFTFFLIPEFLVGTPTYDVAACTAYIIDKLQKNGFYIKYTYPNLLFISWQHYLDKMKRAEIKRVYGVSVDGQGNTIKDKDKTKDVSSSNNTSFLLTNRKVTVEAKPKKEYRDASTYKPTGNLIYNNALLQKIEDKTK